MSPITDLQARLRESGRIRLGALEDYTNRAGKTGKRPVKLDTFRLTSERRDLLDAAAAVYGGQVQRWTGAPDGSGDQWELVIESLTLDVMVPPGQGMTQWYELWRGGGCERRCTGERMIDPAPGPCLCPADKSERMELAGKGEACKPTTRVSVWLSKIPDIATWRVQTGSYYAAMEFGPEAEMMAALADKRGAPIPTQLRILHKTIKRPGQVRKDFTYPGFSLPVTTETLYQLGGPALAPAQPLLNAGGRTAIPRQEPELPDRQPFAGLQQQAVATSDAEDGVVEGESREAAVPTPDECLRAATTKGMTDAQWTALLRQTFPDRRKGEALSEAQLVALMDAIDAWQPGEAR